ncbi:probable NADH dehydrogenase [ubiquinone] 1 alpha subcomplex subunit 12 [Aricia agestis]|uniref:probable NADH dehydrogenase [ubiquinone] 1 alpha subcomplex subunit 12 n=1 Tax=Aricia agestis TaxID=91739 RepID=UPI001C20755E|nr:probable NADH dehydrogenase [ubiquinone] 1 alpha subcomplex subunit 12 [Aricia agestis]
MSKLLKLIPYEKWRFALDIVKHNGGIIKSLEKMWRMDTLKIGAYKGTDSFGNKYFENPYYMVGRSRWVEYNPAVKWHYDASQVTPEWFGWLHYKTDKIPEADCPRVNLMKDVWAKQWLLPHEENLTGTNRAYYPYSTTKPHIHLWDGRNTSNRCGCFSKNSILSK